MLVINFVWTWIVEHATILATVISAVATGAIAFFTISLARATNKQGLLTQHSINLARQEFNATFRPKIRVQAVLFTSDFEDEESMEKIGAEVIFFNEGGTYAEIHEVNAKITNQRIPIKAGLPLNKVPTYIHRLDGGTKGVVTIRGQMERSAAALYMSDGQTRVFCIGNIVYSGPDGGKRETGFCRMLNLQAERWERHIDEAYDYGF